jgi:hypothetical protein
MPTIDEETSNRLGDVARDLRSVANGETDARKDLADDLRVFAIEEADALTAVDDLARQVADALAGKPLTDEQARVIAEDLFTSTAARELSPRQVEALRTETAAGLVAAGVPEETARNVAAQVDIVQQAVARPRRWYEVF